MEALKAPAPPVELEFSFTPLILPEEAGAMTSTQLAMAIAEKYPKYNEGECISYLEGGGRAATLLGLEGPAVINGFMSEWSRFDEKLYVASLFLAVRTKAAQFQASMGLTPGSGIIQ